MGRQVLAHRRKAGSQTLCEAGQRVRPNRSAARWPTIPEYYSAPEGERHADMGGQEKSLIPKQPRGGPENSY